MRNTLRLSIILIMIFNISCKSQSQKNSEMIVYNDYFNFTSNSVLNSVLQKMDIKKVNETGDKFISFNSYLPYDLETEKYELIPIDSIEVFDARIKNNPNTEGYDIRFSDFDKLDKVFKELATNGQVKSIRLNIHFIDTLPNSLYNIESLENIEFWTSKLKYISPDIKNFKNLERLRIHEAQELVNIPQEIGELSNLRILEIDEGNYYGSVKRDLSPVCKLVKLEYLRLQNFPINIPAGFSNLENIKLVEIYNHFQWYDIDLKNLYLNDKIKSLMLTGVGNEDLVGLENLKLEEIFIGRRTSLDVFKHLSKNDNLTKLKLTTDYDSIPANIGDCKNLKLLIFRNCEAVKELPTELNRLPNLKIIVLRNNFALEESNIDLSKLPDDLIVFTKRNEKMNEIKGGENRVISNGW